MTRVRQICYHASRLALGGLFLWAGLLKVRNVDAFAGAVAGYDLLPFAFNYLVAATLPWVELAAGFALVVNRMVRPAALLLAGLTLVFMGVLASALLRGLEVDCGCFGAADRSSPLGALVRDAGILVLAHLTFHLRPLFRGSAAPR